MIFRSSFKYWGLIIFLVKNIFCFENIDILICFYTGMCNYTVMTAGWKWSTLPWVSWYFFLFFIISICFSMDSFIHQWRTTRTLCWELMKQMWFSLLFSCFSYLAASHVLSILASSSSISVARENLLLKRVILNFLYSCRHSLRG